MRIYYVLHSECEKYVENRAKLYEKRENVAFAHVSYLALDKKVDQICIYSWLIGIEFIDEPKIFTDYIAEDNDESYKV